MSRAAVAVLRTALAVLTLQGCAREPIDAPCVDVVPGDLVITELHGLQRGEQVGEWLEIFNASGVDLDLAGLRVVAQKLDGSQDAALIVRRAGTTVAAGAYAVLGRWPDDGRPAFVDYGYEGDLEDELYASAAIDLIACDVQVDRVRYSGLPDFGGLALDGAVDPPNADANDDATSLCVDDAIDDANPSAGAVGTPGAPNPVCP